MPKRAKLDDILTGARGFMEAQIILTAHEMGILGYIGQNRATPEDLAARTGCSERGIIILLDSLAAIGLIEKEGDCYSNTETGLRHLVEDGDDYRGAVLDHIIRMRDMWLKLGEAVRTGTSTRRSDESFVYNRERNRSFILAMRDLGTTSARVIAENLDLSSFRNMLDLGGGPGSYSMEIIKRFPNIRSTIVDLPLTLEVADEVVSAAGMRDKVDFREADFFCDAGSDIGQGYDLALISNVLHIECPDKNRTLLKRVFSSMESGGMIIIHEAIINEDRISPVESAIFAVNMLLHRVHSKSDNALKYMD